MRTKQEKLIASVIAQIAIDLEVHEDEGVERMLEFVPTEILEKYLSGDLIYEHFLS